MAENLFDKVKKVVSKTTDKIKEAVKTDDPSEEISLQDSEDLQLLKVRHRRDESEKYIRMKSFDWDRQLKLFIGDHWALAGITIPTYKSDLVVNKWFAAVRSLVSFETDTRPDPVVEARVEAGQPEAEDLIGEARRTESMLDYRWDTAQIPDILTEIYYDRYIFDDGFGMYFWNAEIDDVDFEQIKPQELLVAPGATDIDDADYLIVQKFRSKKWFKINYPDLDLSKINFEAVRREELGYPTSQIFPDMRYENMARVYHYFEDEIWATYTENKLLDIEKNPYWEWREESEQAEDFRKTLAEQGVPEITIPDLMAGFKPITNHLVKPEKPIIHFKGYHLGGEFYSRSLAKQIEKLSLAINKRKCQIHDNADAVGNPQKAVDPSVPKSLVDMITSEPGLKIRINPAMIANLAPQSLPEQTYFDLEDSKRIFDDVVGHHEISRGGTATKRQTAREALLLRETDVAPVRLLMRNSEVAITRLLNGWVQLMGLFYDQPHYIGRIGGTFREAVGTFLTRDEIPSNLSIMIKVGSTLPTSKETKRLEYQRDFGMGAIDILTYLEAMNYPNPKKIVERLGLQQLAQEQAQQGTPQGQPAGQTQTAPMAQSPAREIEQQLT
uniref:Portal protein n=1 Tax=viral metagenome TaxID=1070528 RepID=A0A6H1ZXD7_9ZZZZ